MNNVIVTGASSSYSNSLLALLGSINVNWPNHPHILVYDLGMTEEAKQQIQKAGIELRSIPPFCKHWRKYYTWKLWCFKDVPADNYLWLDAGVCVLRPIDEVFVSTKSIGYFCTTNHWPLKPTLSLAQQHAVGLSNNIVDKAVSIDSGIHGFCKNGIGENLINEAFEIACVEENMKPTDVWHRHDQSLLSALLLKHFSPVTYADHQTYANSGKPTDVINQKIWVHRTRMLKSDQEYLMSCLSGKFPPFIPSELPIPKPESFLMKIRKKIAKIRGRTPPSYKAGEWINDGVKD